MRVFICGIAATTLATCIWIAAEHFSHRELGWMAIGVGLAAGFSVAPKDKESLVRAVLAVLLTAIACVSGRQVYALTLTAATNPTLVIQESRNDVPGDSISPVPVKEETNAPQEKTMAKQQTTNRKVPLAKTMKSNWQSSQWDILWMSFSCLAAYVIGKGGNKNSIAINEDEQPIPSANGE